MARLRRLFKGEALYLRYLMCKLKVKVDFNNRDTSEDLDTGRIMNILHEGDTYCSNNLYEFLNGSFGGDR